jgi:excisionase family DNA binding protein
MIIERTKPIDALAYTTSEAPRVTGRSRTRIKKAIREKELMARKDGRATLIERAELMRWIAAMPTIGRKPEATASIVASVKERPHERGRAYAPSLKPRPAFDTIESKQPRR